MFATLVSDNLKHRKTVEGFLSKETHELKPSVSVQLQKLKSTIFADMLISGCVQSYLDLFFMESKMQYSSRELETFAAILCDSETSLIAGSIVEAIRGFERLVDIASSDNTLSIQLYFATKCLDIATAHNIHVEIVSASLRIGGIHEFAGNLEVALPVYESLDSSEEAAHKVVDVLWLLAVQNPDKAIELYNRALTCATTSVPSRVVDARHRLGDYLLDTGAIEEALEQHTLELEHCLASHDKRQIRARISLADTFQAKGDFDSALTQLNTALDSLPTDSTDKKAESTIKMKLGLIYLEKSMMASDSVLCDKSIALLEEHLKLERLNGDTDTIEKAIVLVALAKSSAMFPDYWEATNDVSKMLRWKASPSLTLN